MLSKKKYRAKLENICIFRNDKDVYYHEVFTYILNPTDLMYLKFFFTSFDVNYRLYHPVFSSR